MIPISEGFLEITAYNPPKHYAILPMIYKSTDASGAVVPKQFTTKDRLQIENHFIASELTFCG